jgi:hypothetical protein
MVQTAVIRSVLIFLFLALVKMAFAQNDSLKPVNGRIIDTFGLPVVSAAIVNLSTGEACISDSAGNFLLHIRIANKIWVKHLSYETAEVLWFPNPYGIIFTIPLTHKTYVLNEVVISSLPKTYSALKQAVEAMPVEKDPMMKYRDMVYAGPLYNPGITIKGPFQMWYDNFSNEAIQKRKLQELIRRDILEKRIEQRFGNETVKRLTGIKEDSLIPHFRRFCNFTEGFILYANDYEFYQAVSRNRETFISSQHE